MSGDELKFQRKRISLTPGDVPALRESVSAPSRGGSRLDRASRTALQLGVLLTELELKRREVLVSATDPEHWKEWFAHHLTDEND